MNAEHLHAIAIAVRADLRTTRAVDLVNSLHAALQNLANQPSDAQAQSTISTTRQELRDQLGAAPSNDFSASWRQSLSDIGIEDLLGNSLLHTVETILGNNQMTPAIGAQELKSYVDRLEELRTHLDSLLEALDWFEIGHEELDPREAAIGILIPREAIDERLEDLGKEMLWLRRALGPFQELTLGSRPDLTVGTIASSDFTVFVHAVPVMAAAVAAAIERVIAAYKGVLEIRRLRNDLLDKGVSEDALAAVDQQANDGVNIAITGVVNELIVQSDSNIRDEGRRNELTTELTNSLRQIANRIDRGYAIDVRVGEPAGEDDDKVPALPNDVRDAITVIRNAARGLDFLKTDGPPILALTDSKTVKAPPRKVAKVATKKTTSKAAAKKGPSRSRTARRPSADSA
jgi:hypothetical protein